MYSNYIPFLFFIFYFVISNRFQASKLTSTNKPVLGWNPERLSQATSAIHALSDRVGWKVLNGKSVNGFQNRPSSEQARSWFAGGASA